MNEDFYISLIIKKLSGEISEAEDQSLNQWIEESDKNRDIYQNYVKTWDLTEDAYPELEIDLDSEFDRLKSKLPAEDDTFQEAAEEPKIRRLNYRTLLAAASILLITGLAYLFLQPDEKIQYVEVSTTDQMETIILPDSSKVLLNKNSNFKYPESFASERDVELTGEAFFYVSHDPSSPFRVSFGNEMIEVLGTSFNISAYPDEVVESVFVRTGRVRFSSTKTDAVELTKNDKVEFNKKDGTLDSKNNVAEKLWFVQEIKFADATMKQVIQKLSEKFDVRIQLEKQETEDCLFTSTFEEQDLDSVLDVISEVMGYTVIKVDEKHYKLSGGSCL